MEEVDEIIKAHDANGDGLLQFDEFCTVFRNHRTESIAMKKAKLENE